MTDQLPSRKGLSRMKISTIPLADCWPIVEAYRESKKEARYRAAWEAFTNHPDYSPTTGSHSDELAVQAAVDAADTEAAAGLDGVEE